MANNKPRETFKLTSPGILTYRHLEAASAVGGKGKEKFDVNVELTPEHPDVPMIKAILAKVAGEAFPGRDFSTLQFPLKSGDALADAAIQRARQKAPNSDPGDPRDFSRGKLVIIARTEFRPSLAAVVNGRVVDIDGSDLQSIRNLFYPGCEVFGTFSATAYEGAGQNPDGVNLYVDEVFSLNRGEKLKIANTRSAADSFRGYVGLTTDYDPTTGSTGGGQNIPL